MHPVATCPCSGGPTTPPKFSEGFCLFLQPYIFVGNFSKLDMASCLFGFPSKFWISASPTAALPRAVVQENDSEGWGQLLKGSYLAAGNELRQ